MGDTRLPAPSGMETSPPPPMESMLHFYLTSGRAEGEKKSHQSLSLVHIMGCNFLTLGQNT